MQQILWELSSDPPGPALLFVDTIHPLCAAASGRTSSAPLELLCLQSTGSVCKLISLGQPAASGWVEP